MGVTLGASGARSRPERYHLHDEGSASKSVGLDLASECLAAPQNHDMLPISARLLPRTARPSARGLTVGGVALLELAERHGTPLFVYDAAHLRQRCRELVSAFGAENVSYASKAFTVHGHGVARRVRGAGHRRSQRRRARRCPDGRDRPVASGRSWEQQVRAGDRTGHGPGSPRDRGGLPRRAGPHRGPLRPWASRRRRTDQGDPGGQCRGDPRGQDRGGGLEVRVLHPLGGRRPRRGPGSRIIGHEVVRYPCPPRVADLRRVGASARGVGRGGPRGPSRRGHPVARRGRGGRVHGEHASGALGRGVGRTAAHARPPTRGGPARSRWSLVVSWRHRRG